MTDTSSTSQTSNQSTIDRLAQLLQDLQAEEAAAMAAAPNPAQDQLIQTASLATALSSSTHTLPSLVSDSSHTASLAVQPMVRVNRLRQAKQQVRQRYIRAKPNLVDLLQAIRGASAAPVMPSVMTTLPTPSAVRPAQPTRPPELATTAILTRPSISGYIKKLGNHFAQHGRLVLTNYRVSSKV